MATVKQEFAVSGDDKVAAAYRKLAERVTELEDKNTKLSQSVQNHTNRNMNQQTAFEAVLRRQIGALGGVAAGWMSLQSIVQAVNADMERSARIQRDAAEAAGKLARGQAELFLNTFGQDDATKAKYMAAAQAISSDTGVKETDVLQSLGRQAGRGVGMSPEQIIAAQHMATRLGRHTPEQIEPLSTVIQQTMRATGKDVEWAAALAQSGAAAAFPGDPKLQSRFLQQALTGSLANISQPDANAAEQIFEIAAALSQAGGEERGEAGRTATISLLAQFDEFREGRGKWMMQSPWGGKPRMNPVQGAPTAPGDVIEWLRDNPNQMKRFFEKASFEQHYEGIIRRMIMEPGSQVGRLYSDTKQAVGPDVSSLNRQLTDLERGTPQIVVTNESAKAEAGVEQVKSRLTREQVTENINKARNEALDLFQEAGSRRFTGMAMRSHSLAGDILGWGMGYRAEYKLDDLRHMREEFLKPGFGSPFEYTPKERLTVENRAIYDKLDALVKSAEKQVELLQQQDKENAKYFPGAGPAMNGQFGRSNER